MSDPWALARYQAIAAYIALPPPRGERRALLEQLAARTWTGPDGAPFTVSSETLRVWARRYRNGGLDGLRDAPHPQPGVRALNDAEIAIFCALKREVPARSLDRLIEIAEALNLVEAGKAKRSTVHRALRAQDLSARRPARVPRDDLDRFEASFPNELWQSDMLEGPLLPDPARPGATRRAWLYTFLDDHSRMCLHGRFSFKGDLPALELVFRRSIQKFGVPARVYYDNGAVYRSGHMKQIVAALGIHGIVFTRVYRPMGHGKIEAFNRLITSAFLAEVAVSGITTLDGLNEAWLAWSDGIYNRRVHGETGQAPADRWRSRRSEMRFADETQLREAFLWSEPRTPDKAGIFSLFGTEYQVGPGLAKQRIEVRYDPEDLSVVEVWHAERLRERVRPFVVERHRRPHPVPGERQPRPSKPAVTGNYLGHLVQKRRAEGFLEPTPRALAESLAAQREEADAAVFDALASRVDPAVLDPTAIRSFLSRFGPWDPVRAAELTDAFFALHPRDTHVQVLLDHLNHRLKESRR